ncbi:hypothetical protein D0962_33950 [Leptolyngbyaceae cyanobacterium CCMR0082]|uniref:Uncharacterized protein n=1 Tax=Adonisia turfae CCMR0082 TaxID=2304604 RepID=A0A6M0SGK9_9CYAN|nr:hypothetical protein [Adonisia turfae]MDV3347973.1 hypothetical protein [Leptothoe sp. LEGE 181152]NEZ67708.1 hypothetical protein [Adonisia turfae CCMR0082]
MISKENNSSYSISINTSPAVDFCIWVLEIDGLNVAPFDKHSDGNGSLRETGMTCHSWQSWLNEIVVLRDPRLSWQVPSLQTEINKKVATDMEMIPRILEMNPNISPSSISVQSLEARHRKLLEWQESQHQIALNSIPQLLGRSNLPERPSNPVEYWRHDVDVKLLLEKLWLEYNSRIFFERRETCRLVERVLQESGNALQNALQPYLSSLPVLNFNIVNYVEPVEYIVPPISALIGDKPSSNNNDDLLQRIVYLARNLAEFQPS